MKFHLRVLVVLMPLLAATGMNEASSQEPGSFRLDPKTGQFEEGKRDYIHADANEILKSILIDWMTNPQIKDQPYGYLIAPNDTDDKIPPPKLKRLLIDERYVPKGFALKIPEVTVEFFDRSKRDLELGEMCIRIDRFEVRKDGSIEAEFLHAGYGIIGGCWVTYTAKKEKMKWNVEFSGSFDP